MPSIGPKIYLKRENILNLEINLKVAVLSFFNFKIAVRYRADFDQTRKSSNG